MNSARRIIYGSAIVVVFLLAFPYLFPLGSFIPRIESAASERIGEPVKVETLRLFLLPRPRLVAYGMTAGRKPFVTVDRVSVTPDLFSIFGEQKVIRELRVQGVVLARPLSSRLLSLAGKTQSAAPAPVRVERVRVQDAEIRLAEFKLRQVEFDAELTGEGRVSSFVAHADRGRLEMILTPSANAFAVDITARDWRLPAGPPMLLSSFKARGTLGSSGLMLPEIEGLLYGGKASGNLAVAWEKEWSIQGRLDIADVEVQPVVALFTKETVVSGKLSAKPVIDMHAPTAAQLGQALDVEADFRLANGVLYKVDLGNAAKALLDKDAVKGGQTRFDEFSGHLLVDAAGYHLSELKISSGKLSAEGEISVAPDQTLSGRMDVAMKGASALVSTPLAVSGTLGNPSLFPTKAVLAGAAAGTALLGPGVGTTIGMKAAQITERLFSRKPVRKKKPDPAAPPADAQGAAQSTSSQSEKAPATTGR